MKKLIVLLAMATIGAQAAKIETCRTKVLNACRGHQYGNYLIQKADQETNGDQCNIIAREKREGTQNDFSPERVVFKDSQVLFSVVTTNEGAGEAQKCSYREVDLKGSFVETKINSGRMFAVTSDGYIAVITRTNSVQWLVNTESGPNQGKRFFNVVDISIDSQADVVKIKYKNGQVEQVSLKEALVGLNKYKQCVSKGCDN